MTSINKSKTNGWNTRLRDELCLITGLIAFLINVLSSCCTDMYCNGAHDIGMIEMLNFYNHEVDSTYLVFYQKDSDFKIAEDSLMIDIARTGDSAIFYGLSSKKINVDYDYRLYFTLIHKEYEISGFKTIKAECNEKCWPIKDYYYKVVGYEINGNYKECSSLKIDQEND